MEPYYRGAKTNIMANIACIMGLISIFMTQTFFVPVCFGSLGIILAILSKGYERKLSVPARTGFVTSIIGIVFAIAFAVGSLWMYTHDAEYRTEIERNFEVLTGMTIEEYYNHYSTNMLEKE